MKTKCRNYNNNGTFTIEFHFGSNLPFFVYPAGGLSYNPRFISGYNPDCPNMMLHYLIFHLALVVSFWSVQVTCNKPTEQYRNRQPLLPASGSIYTGSVESRLCDYLDNEKLFLNCNFV